MSQTDFDPNHPELPELPDLPREPIHRFTAPFQRFLHIEAASGVVLLLCTVVALILANSQYGEEFLAFWKTKMGFRVGTFEMFYSIKHWINDGLMVIFFFVIGLEVKRELVVGELNSPRKAALPVAAALGGMVAPAAIYLFLLAGDPAQHGWGIPMATDIAFVVGCMAVLGKRVPRGLNVLLLSLAIADDIGAILVIAIGYTESLNLSALGLAFVGLALVALMSRIGVRSFGVYTLIGAGVWFGFHESGVHATIAGVLLGLLTPAHHYVGKGTMGKIMDRARGVVTGQWELEPDRAAKVRQFQWAVRETIPPVEYLENLLHPWVSFVIMPLFALANAGVPFEAADFGSPVAIAVMAGLILGKPIGILSFSWLAIRLRLAQLPGIVTWRQLVGGGCLAGIGFTMALFIAGLALTGDPLDEAKVGILGGSAISAVLGILILLRPVREKQQVSEES